jgi:hypothetical protein
MLVTYTPGAELKFDFQGTAIGLYMTPGPDAGILEYSIDSNPFTKYDPFTRWSTSLYIPWLHILEAELENKQHTLILRLTPDTNEKSTGHACQIYYFAVNGSKR